MGESYNGEISSSLNHPWLCQEIDKNQSSQECDLEILSCSFAKLQLPVQNDDHSNVLSVRGFCNASSNDGPLENAFENVKGLKKKEGRKGRKRLKSWVEK